MNIPISVWIDYFYELSVNQAIKELSFAGFTTSAVISLPIGIALMIGTLVIIKLATKKKA